MRFLLLLLLLPISAMAAPSTNSMADYPEAEYNATNRLLGVTKSGSPFFTKLYSLPFQFTALTTNNITNLYIFTPGTSAGAITNAIGQAPYRTRVKFSGPWGYSYHIPTNTSTWARPGLDYEVDPGVTVVFGTSGDAVSRPIFNDALAAVTNHIMGYGSFVVSNLNSTLVDISSPGSVMLFECNKAWRTATTADAAVFKQYSGTELYVWAREQIRNEGYDGFWLASSAGARTFICTPRIAVADTAIEMVGDYDDDKPGIFNVDYIERLNNGITTGPLIQLYGNAYLKGEQIYGITNNNIWISYQGGASARPAVLDYKNIQFKSIGSGNYPFSVGDVAGPYGTFRVVNARIDFPTNSSDAQMLVWDARLSLDNCDLKAPIYATHSIQSFGTAFLDACGVKINKGLDMSALTLETADFRETNSVTVALTGDDQAINTTNVARVYVTSDAAAASRTMKLSPGMWPGKRLEIFFSGASNGAQLLDDGAAHVSGNHRLTANWDAGQYDAITVEWDGTDWREVSRSLN